MNNNQFKAFIRDKIEAICKNNYQRPIYIDRTCNSRTYYIYDADDLSVQGTIDVWTGDSECSVRVSYNKEKVVSLAKYDLSFSGTYMELDKIIEGINKILSTMTKLPEVHHE